MARLWTPCAFPPVSYTHLDVYKRQAQEIFAEDHAYTLNVLLLCQDDALRELSISFDSMEALA